MTAHVRSWRNGAKESRAVAVSIDHADAGEHTGSILITARPSGDAAGGLGFGAAVRIPVSFQVKSDIYRKVIMVAVGLLAVIAAALLLWVRRTKV